MKIKSLLMYIGFLLITNSSFADSPLTSTPIYKGYLDIPIIKKQQNLTVKLKNNNCNF